jgi:hypothetical protein
MMRNDMVYILLDRKLRVSVTRLHATEDAQSVNKMHGIRHANLLSGRKYSINK